ncbi:MAG: putative bifunctional diguanylate cyclase/phosphodiesterase, partial [Acidimicrobiales bacterium]
ALYDHGSAARWVETTDRPLGFAVARVVGTIGLVAVVVLFPSLGAHRFEAGAYLAVVTTPLEYLIERHTPAQATDRIHVWHDTITCVVVIALLPAAFVLGLVMGTAVIVASAVGLTRAHYLLVSWLYLMGMAAVAVTEDVYAPTLPLTVSGLALVMVGEHSLWYRRRFTIATRRTSMLIDSAGAVFFEVDPSALRFRSVNGQVDELLGRSAPEVVGAPVGEVIHAEDLPLLSRLAAGDSVAATVRCHHPDGSLRWLRTTTRLIDDRGERSFSGVAVDVTELEHSKHKLRRRAERDPLTGLQNRDVLTDALADQLRVDPKRAAIAIIDLDGFKRLNDTLGHPAGDEFLQLMGRRIGVLGGDGVRVGRLGGDEFAILVTGEAAGERIEAVARDALAAIATTVEVDGVDVQLTASIGIAPGHEGVVAADMLRDADIAMYQAKRARSGIRVFTDRPEELTRDQLGTSARIARSLEDELELWFQPVVETSARRIVAVEGLARWRHPELGILEPASFLPAVEQGGLSERLDWFALGSAAEFATRARADASPSSVAVNVSVVGLRSPQLLPYLRSLARDGFELDDLTIEISETDLHEDVSALTSTFHALRDLGVGLSLDDYGTGFSSLIRLREMPFTEIKIDRSFVAHAGTDSTDAAIVRSTVDLANELGLVTVAEGVESELIHRLLRGMGCRRAQGFLYSRARPLGD